MIQNETAATQVNSVDNCRLFSKRTCSYKLGSCLIFPSFIMYVVTVGSTAWINTGVNHYGLWNMCNVGSVGCGKKYMMYLSSQILSCVCIAGYLITIAVAFYENCRRLPTNYHSRKLEGFIFITAIIGTAANLLFVFFYAFSWFIGLDRSYGINVVAIVILFLAGILVGSGNLKLNVNQGMTVTTNPQHRQPGMVCHQGQPGGMVQTVVYNYPTPPSQAIPLTQPVSYTYPAPPQPQPLPPYGFCPNPQPTSPPPPYTFPPTYPHGGQQAPPLPSVSYYEQRQVVEASAPLLSECEKKTKN